MSHGPRPGLVMGSLRERGTVVLVGGLTGFYGAVMVCSADLLAMVAKDGGGNIGAMLNMVSAVFIGIALYVGGVVIAGCVATVIAGRLAQIATLRLLGSTAAQLRRSIGRASATAAGLGSVGGTTLGLVACDAVRRYLMHTGKLPRLSYDIAPPLTVLVLVAVTAMAALAGFVGSRKVLSVTPSAAFSGMTDAPSSAAKRSSAVVAIILTLVGGAGLALACFMGEKGSPLGFLMAFVASITLVTAVLVGATWFVPAAVRLVSMLGGRTTPARIAARNAVADPQRTARSTLGLIVGVMLVVTFMSGADALVRSVNSWHELSAEQKQIAVKVLDLVSQLLTAIVAISSVIAAVGFVSTMSLVVLQRRREIGLLRALGLTTRQVRDMVTLESLALGVTAVTLGMVLGTVFGSLGAQSLIGFLNDGLVIGLPWQTFLAVAGCALLLVLMAALPPARTANKETVVDALHV